MAIKMNITEVFKILLDGGWITHNCPAVQGKSTYSVVAPGTGFWPGTKKGHITENQFEELVNQGIIEFSGNQSRDKHGNFYSFYYLRKPHRLDQ